MKPWKCVVCGRDFIDENPPKDYICDSCRIKKEKVGHVVYYEEGKKNDQDKPRIDLIPPEAINAIAKIFRYGAKKYGERNWEKGIKANRLFAAVQRHLWKWWAGKDLDEESKLPHLWHALCGLAMLVATMERMPEMDNRPQIEKKVVVEKLQSLKEKLKENLEGRIEKLK